VVRILDGRLFAFVAFDVGFEIDLERARRLLQGTRAPALRQERPTPPEVEYPEAPVEVGLGEQLLLGGTTAVVSARLFDFGVVSILYTVPLPPTLEALAPCGRALLDQAGLVALAEEHMQALVQRVAPAVARLQVADLSEEYFVFQVSELDGRPDAETLLREHGADLARAIALEPAPLAPAYVRELLDDAVTYAPNDVVVSAWRAAVVYDRLYDDTVAVFESLNIQLLELRFQDRRLDRALERVGPVRPRRRGLGAFLNPYRQPVRELAELTMESTLLAERAANAMKLLGDDYLARVARKAGDRLHLADWAASIRRKQEAVTRLYETLNGQLANQRAEALELAIVLLIVFEIVLFFSGGG
jgi:hypothetical protein